MLCKILQVVYWQMNVKENDPAFSEKSGFPPVVYRSTDNNFILCEAWVEVVLWQVALAVCALASAVSSGCCPQWLLLHFEALFLFFFFSILFFFFFPERACYILLSKTNSGFEYCIFLKLDLL